MTEMRDQCCTDMEAFEQYHSGIADSLKAQHEHSVDSLERELQQMKSLEPFQGGKFRAE